jgi:hypothetical protein
MLKHRRDLIKKILLMIQNKEPAVS